MASLISSLCCNAATFPGLVLSPIGTCDVCLSHSLAHDINFPLSSFSGLGRLVLINLWDLTAQGTSKLARRTFHCRFWKKHTHLSIGLFESIGKTVLISGAGLTVIVTSTLLSCHINRMHSWCGSF